MDRLTTTNGNGYIQLKIDDKYVRISDLDILQIAKKLKEYEDMEEQGKLLKLPCKIGDKIYHIENNQIEEFVVSSFDIKPLQMFACNDKGKRINIKQFGKTAFLSKEEAALHIKTQEEKDMSTESLIGKRYLDKQRLPGALKEVVNGPNEWGNYIVKDLKTGKEHLCGRIYIMENEVDEKSFEEWWDELDDIEKEEYNAYMSEGSEELLSDEIEK